VKIRLPAEWEKQKSILVVFPTTQKDWQHSIEEIQESYVKFIKEITRFQKCIVICNDKKVLGRYFDVFENIEVHQIETNDTWIRDFGAISVFVDDKLKFYNFIFNAWGDKFESSLDNDFNNKFFKNDLIDIDFILEGGSIDCNGAGVMLSTAKCIFNQNRNSTCNEKDISDKIKKLFELKELIVLNNGALMGDDTDSHIDTLARFIDENSIVYTKCYDKNDIHYEELKKMEKELQKTDFRLIPLPLPNAKFYKGDRLPATYVNFVFINGAVIVPTYKDENDKKVIEIFKKELPNREIVPIDSSIFIRENGSLHCSSINQMLQI
jgi:agmatine/peptidylarginine deiminase